MPGNHHFYITFKTQAQDVNIPQHLIERYPDEMTIVIQNRYWDLHVSPSGFEVGLSFNQVGSKLAIPFAAITAFHDPAVDFALHFSAQVEDQQVKQTAFEGSLEEPHFKATTIKLDLESGLDPTPRTETVAVAASEGL